jgi:hypothetical protein
VGSECHPPDLTSCYNYYISALNGCASPECRVAEIGNAGEGQSECHPKGADNGMEIGHNTAPHSRRWSSPRAVVVLTGAGLSTASGIPDFRSPGGRWERYQPIRCQTSCGVNDHAKTTGATENIRRCLNI